MISTDWIQIYVTSNCVIGKEIVKKYDCQHMTFTDSSGESTYIMIYTMIINTGYMDFRITHGALETYSYADPHPWRV